MGLKNNNNKNKFQNNFGCNPTSFRSVLRSAYFTEIKNFLLKVLYIS